MADNNYTFMDTIVSQNPNTGAMECHVVVDATVFNIEDMREANGKPVINARLAINGHSRTINSIFQCNFQDDEPIWVSVSFWSKNAERFNNFISKAGGGNKYRLVLTGVMQSSPYQRKDGSYDPGIRILVNRWEAIRTQSSQNGQNQKSQAPQYQQPQAPQYQQPQAPQYQQPQAPQYQQPQAPQYQQPQAPQYQQPQAPQYQQPQAPQYQQPQAPQYQQPQAPRYQQSQAPQHQQPQGISGFTEVDDEEGDLPF